MPTIHSLWSFIFWLCGRFFSWNGWNFCGNGFILQGHDANGTKSPGFIPNCDNNVSIFVYVFNAPISP